MHLHFHRLIFEGKVLVVVVIWNVHLYLLKAKVLKATFLIQVQNLYIDLNF